MKRKIKDILVPWYQRLKHMDYIVYYLYYAWVKKLDNKQILLLSDSRESLTGNLYFIDQKIDKNEFNVSYFLHKSILDKKSSVQKKELCKMLAVSKYILVDDFYPVIYPIPLRKETKLIQVWHAMGAFKKMGFSRMGKTGGPSPYSLTHRNYTDAIVSSEYIRENYAEAFKLQKDSVHAIGIPRTDIFFDESYKKEIQKQLYEKYPSIKGKKVILFAPTFRGNGIKTAHYNYDWLSLKKIEQKLGDDYVFIIKMHPFVKDSISEDVSEECFLDLSGEREINDLLFVTDILVTDYSSVIFEASLLNIPTVFFAPDFEEYVRTRDFYYPYEEYTYGPVVKTDDELIDVIKETEVDFDKLRRFKEKFCKNCDGASAQRFVDTFFKR